MRPLRFLLTLLTSILAFFLLLFLGPWRMSSGAPDAATEAERSGIRTYFDWRTPSSLFPPSAIISLTDDNSTFFLARPAAFGPLLPVKSLSAQLWVGSGFGEDHLGGGFSGGGRGVEGELGCSDIPDWVGDGSKYHSKTDGKTATSDAKDNKSGKGKRGLDEESWLDEEEAEEPLQDDGTDDHLHHPLPPSDGLKTNGASAGNSKKPTHADIQSLQEGAEIAGKIVLLSRGGCGFLEKVKWVQRRGGVGLIVGDDIRGGPLVTMYARGDTSNVTIPSLFTSHTTAHLLSSLIPSGGILDDLSAEEVARLGLALGEAAKDSTKSETHGDSDKPNFTTTSVAVKSTQTAKAEPKKASKHQEEEVEEDQVEDSRGWLRSLFSSRSENGRDSRRPPSSGSIGWVLENFEDDEEEYQPHRTTSTSSAPTSTKAVAKAAGDGFQIGVQDWRDPDLVAEAKERQLAGTASSTSSSSAATAAPSKIPTKGFKGGSITPGSGEYVKAHHEAVDIGASSHHPSSDAKEHTHATDSHQRQGNWFTRLFSSHNSHQETEHASKKTDAKTSMPVSQPPKIGALQTNHRIVDGQSAHEGLWVTLTPTSMSSSPFFDTLLVLVVSPLVTLTVVYALLLLRSRIRRRRWRAPKSVVERLPVRTYQTMASSPATSSTTSSAASPITATSPLLPTSARPINARSRPRARTESEVPSQPLASSSVRSDELAPPSLEHIEEKRAAGLAEWRRRYGGRQRECVVCLEEYVDGVSRVMSLPCGHEFHEGCITPWLTTRRRTCPICKGDVVRSLARNNTASGSTPPAQQYHDDPNSEDEADVQEQAATTRNDDPVAQQPVSREDEAFEDLERGVTEVDRNR